jgi:hypothetical protein
MHSTFVRLQNVFGFFTVHLPDHPNTSTTIPTNLSPPASQSVAFAVAAAIAVSVLLSPQSPTASLELKNVRVYALPFLPSSNHPTNQTHIY